jgi:hypothetical protein
MTHLSLVESWKSREVILRVRGNRREFDPRKIETRDRPSEDTITG